MRLIDADALIECLQTWKTAAVSEGLPINERFAVAMIAQVNLMPTIEPERKKGKWLYGEDDGQDGWYCSECGGFVPWDYDYYGLDNIDFIKDFKTCPHCDARMISYTGKKEGEQE